MTNRIVRLGLGLLAGSCLSGVAMADCTPSPDCGTLGYNKSASGCNGAPYVRCPFDTTKVVCLVSVKCEDGGYLSSCPTDYNCTTKNFGGNVCYIKGAAKTCEEKGQKTCNGSCIATTQCCTNSDCSSGYECNTSTHGCEERKTCAVGDIYYSDKTCSTSLNASKTPIGVVGSISNGGKNGIVVEMNHSSSTMQWGCYGTDLSCISNKPGSDGGANPELRADYNGKSNTACMVSNGCTSGTYCNNRSVGGVTGWYLPAGGELYDTMIGNRTAVNSGLSKISGSTQIPSSGQGYYYWSSSEYNSRSAWIWGFYGGDIWYYNPKSTTGYARCVLAF